MLLQGKEKPVSILNNEFCEEQAVPYLLPEGKTGYNTSPDIAISPGWYFNQRLLNFNQYFASDANYLFFARSVYEQYRLRPSIKFAMYKIKPGILTAGTAKKNFKKRNGRSVAYDYIFIYELSQRNTSILEIVFIWCTSYG